MKTNAVLAMLFRQNPAGSGLQKNSWVTKLQLQTAIEVAFAFGVYCLLLLAFIVLV
jgi:hypothetical protein